MKRKLTIICCISLMSVLMLTSLSVSADTKTELSADESKKLSEYGKILKTEKLQKESLFKFGGSNPFITEFNRIVNGRILVGETMDEAINNATSYLIKREAIYNKSVSAGFDVPESELNDYVLQQIELMKNVEALINEFENSKEYNRINDCKNKL